jgi:hypothetical protein
MRTRSLIRHESWSVLVELRFSRQIGLGGVMADVHHFEADEVRWGSEQNQGLQLNLLRRGEKVVSCSARFLTRIRLLSVPAPGSRTHARWHPDEDTRLGEERALDTPLAGIARILGRSEGAVHSRMSALPSSTALGTQVLKPRTEH